MDHPVPPIFERRRAGVLLHVSSLPGPHGIGDLGPAAHAFVDWCAAAGISVWQMLPVGPLGHGGSPYSSTSSFAGEPLFVSLDALAADGLLARSDLRVPREHRALRRGCTDHAAARAFKLPRLQKAWAAWRLRRGHVDAAYGAFVQAAKPWLPGWCRFAAAQPGGEADPEFHAFLQWQFERQWRDLRAHCRARGVLLLGDVPLFVSAHSADVADHPELFRLDAAGRPTVVTGVPPDCFSRTGQRWGHPHYRWAAHRRTRFDWWIARIRHALARCDALRIDHFVGLVQAYEIPGRAHTARRGAWRPAPGRQLLVALERACGRLPLVAEDLGAVTEAVTTLRRRFGLPGMKLVHWAFDAPWSGELPSLHPVDCVAYAGTHDNSTTVGWWRGLSSPARARFRAYTGLAARSRARAVGEAMVRIVLASPARTAIVAMQDLLGLGDAARLNVPGRSEGQWGWRMRAGALRGLDPGRFRVLTEATARA